MDDKSKKTLSSIPLLKTKGGPRDKDLWPQRLKEEYQALIQYVQNNKASDNDWFRLESNKEGTRWFGKCWHIHNLLKYEFDIEFDIPVTFPATAPEITLPELDGKTAKMYRGGKICLSDHFKPLWARNVPKFGIAHAMALGLGPWLAVEIPDMIEKGIISYKEKDQAT
uniref:Ubiquitin-fold modifier-conjugating enzyme 1 n=1 Tax=Clastoptera arizonana TaxID=38151 RepID=A0A1B6CWL9_9HEMI